MMARNKIVNFISYPSGNAVNPFIGLLNHALSEKGYVEVRDINVLYSLKNALKYRKQIRILHFHWPEYLWRSNNLAISVIKGFRFVLAILMVKLIGYKLVFSAHNVIPHFGRVNIWFEKRMREFILLTFDLVIGHSRLTDEDLHKVYDVKPKRYLLVIHGLYDNFLAIQGNRYPHADKVDQIKLYVAYSNNAYKGSADFLSLFDSLDNSLKKHFHIVFNGAREDAAAVRATYPDLDHTWIRSGRADTDHLSDEEMVGLVKGIDVFVLPYKKITTSGAFFMALTFNKRVIATPLPFFTAHNDAGNTLFYHDRSSLEKALNVLVAGHEAMNEDNNWKERFSWKRSAGVLADTYDDMIAI